MRFWDSSAVIPLLIAEPSTSAIRAAYRDDPVMLVWWGTTLECVSAISRREREGALRAADANKAIRELDGFAAEWHEVTAGEQVRSVARRLLRTHDLRAADSLQLAAALAVAEGQQAMRNFVTLDARLADAAQREGFVVAPDDV